MVQNNQTNLAPANNAACNCKSPLAGIFLQEGYYVGWFTLTFIIILIMLAYNYNS